MGVGALTCAYPLFIMSEVAICNSALIKIGAGRINSLDDSAKGAVLCKEQYSKIRDELLESHPWNFAIKRVSLAQLVTGPTYGYTYQYQLPTDCLRVLVLSEEATEFKVEGRYLLTDDESITISYIAQITDTSIFPPMFKDLIARRLASEIAYAMTNSATMTQNMWALYESALPRVRSRDAMEGTPDSLFNRTDWLNSRW